MTMLTISCQSQTLDLLPQRAVFWRERRTLILADLHLGKAATFRSVGIPIPNGTTASDLDRLTQACQLSKPQRLVVLGDFFHARSGRARGTMDLFDQWREQFSDLEIVLLRGNHDIASGDPPPTWRIETSSRPLVDGPFVMAHTPTHPELGYMLCGHVHPSVSLPDPCGRWLRAACFWFQAKQAVLPAFSRFTGSRTIEVESEDRVFAVGPDEVVDVSAMVKPRRQLQ